MLPLLNPNYDCKNKRQLLLTYIGGKWYISKLRAELSSLKNPKNSKKSKENDEKKIKKYI